MRDFVRTAYGRGTRRVWLKTVAPFFSLISPNHCVVCPCVLDTSNALLSAFSYPQQRASRSRRAKRVALQLSNESKPSQRTMGLTRARLCRFRDLSHSAGAAPGAGGERRAAHGRTGGVHQAARGPSGARRSIGRARSKSLCVEFAKG